jgi:hypothetical protein
MAGPIVSFCSGALHFAGMFQLTGFYKYCGALHRSIQHLYHAII